MFDLFSDILTTRDSALARLDARTKLFAALLCLLAVILSKSLVFPLTIMAVCLLGIWAVRVPLKLAAMRLAAPLGVVAMLIVLQAFLTGATPLGHFSILGFSLTPTREGLENGLRLGARVLGCASIMVLLSSVTPAHQIFNALRWCGFPKLWVEVAVLMYRYIFVLLDQAGDVAAAQKVRLGYARAPRALSSLGRLAGTVLVRSLDQSQRTYDAMMVRGYQGYMPFGPLPPFGLRDCGLLCGLVVLIAAAFVGLEGRPW